MFDLGVPAETVAGMHWPALATGLASLAPTLAGGKCNSKSQQVP